MADHNNQRRRRRNAVPIAPQVPAQTFDFQQLMGELILVERHALERERELHMLARRAAEYRDDITRMFEIVPQMMATARAARASRDRDLIEQAGRFQTVINQLSDQLNVLGHQSAHTVRAGIQLSHSFDQATQQFEYLNSALRTIPDFTEEEEEEEEEYEEEEQQRQRRPRSGSGESGQRPSKTPRMTTHINMVDAWLASTKKREALINELKYLSREELFAIADHYNLVFTVSEAKRSITTICTLLSQKLLNKRRH